MRPRSQTELKYQTPTPQKGVKLSPEVQEKLQFYTLQLSPTSVVQPDLQIVWNPTFNPDPGPAVVFQFQFVVKW